MQCAVRFIDSALQEFRALPLDMQAKGFHIIELLETYGTRYVHAPHVRQIDGKLWEMRLSGRDGIARALYFALVGNNLCVVRVFIKKTQKTPRSEIKLAKQRYRDDNTCQ